MVSEKDLDKFLKSTEHSDLDDRYLTFKKPDPDRVVIIVSSAFIVLEKNTTYSLPYILYLTTQEILKKDPSFTNDDSKVGFLFSYYLESYRLIKVMLTSETDITKSHLLYNEALLSFFDLYKLKPNDILIRRLFVKSLESMHRVLISYESSERRQRYRTYSFKQAIGYLSNIALISQTVKDFIKGKRRDSNLKYIEWLNHFFQKALYTDDISFIETYPHFSNVIKQITEKSLTITIPES